MKRFKKVYIEITNQCNLACDFCPLTHRPAAFVTQGHMEHVLTAVKPFSDHVYFHLMGEPLLHPEINRFLQMAGDLGLKVNLTTNGTLLKTVGPSLIQQASLRQVNVSLTSFEGNVAKLSLEEQQVALKTYLDEMLTFVSEAQAKSSVIVSLRLWNLKNDEEAPVAASQGLNGQMVQRIADHFGLQEQALSHALRVKTGLKLAERVYLNTAYYFEWPSIDREPFGETGFCYGLRDQIGILTDGRVVPCCLDGDGQIPLGNLYTSSLQDILDGPRAQALYDGFSNRKMVEALCQRCGYARQF